MASTVYDEIVASVPSLKGVALHDLGLEENWSKLGNFLAHVEGIVVVDEATRKRAIDISSAIDQPFDQFYHVISHIFGLVDRLAVAGDDKGLKLLKRVLALGANTNFGDIYYAIPMEIVYQSGNIKCALALALCCPESAVGYVVPKMQSLLDRVWKSLTPDAVGSVDRMFEF